MEVFVSDFGSNPEKVDLERKNDESSVNVRRQVVNEIFDTRKDSHMDKSSKQQRLLDIQNFQTQIKDDAINAEYAFKFFNEQEYMAVERQQNLLDLQVGGQAYEDHNILSASLLDQHTLPALKLERLAIELTQLEEELYELEKTDIPSGYSDENDTQNHIEEIEHLRIEMEKILGSEAFQSLEGKNKIQNLLNEGTQIGIQKALEEMVQNKITEYVNDPTVNDPS